MRSEAGLPRLCSSRGVTPTGLRVAHPHEADGQGAVEHGGGEGGLSRRGRVEVPPSGQDAGRAVDREVELDTEGPRADGVQPELELGHDPEVPAAAPQPPVELGVLVLGRADHLAVGGDHLEGHDVVAGQAVLPRQPAHAASEREPTDAGVRDVARRGGEPVLLCGHVECAEERAALDPGPTPFGIHPNGRERGQVDHHAALGHRQAEDAVSAAPDADLEVVLAGGTERGPHVVDARAPDDHPGSTVDHGVPDPAGVVVAGLTGQQQLPGEVLSRQGRGRHDQAPLPDRRTR